MNFFQNTANAHCLQVRIIYFSQSLLWVFSNFSSLIYEKTNSENLQRRTWKYNKHEPYQKTYWWRHLTKYNIKFCSSLSWYRSFSRGDRHSRTIREVLCGESGRGLAHFQGFLVLQQRVDAKFFGDSSPNFSFI